MRLKRKNMSIEAESIAKITEICEITTVTSKYGCSSLKCRNNKQANVGELENVRFFAYCLDTGHLYITPRNTRIFYRNSHDSLVACKICARTSDGFTRFFTVRCTKTPEYGVLAFADKPCYFSKGHYVSGFVDNDEYLDSYIMGTRIARALTDVVFKSTDVAAQRKEI